MSLFRHLLWGFTLALSTTPLPAQEAVHLLHLPLGDPAHRDREAPLVLDAITETRSGESLTPAQLAQRLAGVKLLLIGEGHTSAESHRVQLTVIEELVRAGRKVTVGLEMYPYTAQAQLDPWPRGHLTEAGFLALSEWYRHWGYPWPYYRDIFLFAREKGLPLAALNAPREVVSAVRKKGFEGLTPEEAAHVPRPDVSSADHHTLFAAYFSDATDGTHGSGMSPAEMEAMVAAQATWDATMARHALDAVAQSAGDPAAIVVVLVGSGHVAYELGIARQARAQGFSGEVGTLIPVAVTAEGGARIETVRATYADFLWGVAAEAYPLYPDLGLSTTEDTTSPEGPRRKVLFTSPGTPAEAAGFQPGDVLLSFDGTPIHHRATLMERLASKRWGDTGTFVVRRGETTVTLDVSFRRRPVGSPG